MRGEYRVRSSIASTLGMAHAYLAMSRWRATQRSSVSFRRWGRTFHAGSPPTRKSSRYGFSSPEIISGILSEQDGGVVPARGRPAGPSKEEGAGYVRPLRTSWYFARTPSMKTHTTLRAASGAGWPIRLNPAARSVQGRHGPYRRTTGQVRVRVTPSTSWIFLTTSLASASMLEASARAITS